MSASEKPAIKKLSSAVMELKFMKRSKQKLEKEEEDEERRELYKEQLATLHNSSNCIVMMPSFFDIQTYLPCRLSFGGMEPEIEKINISKLTGIYKVETLPEVDTSLMKTDVTEEHMARTYAENKFKRKSQHDGDSQNKRRNDTEETKFDISQNEAGEIDSDAKDQNRNLNDSRDNFPPKRSKVDRFKSWNFHSSRGRGQNRNFNSPDGNSRNPRGNSRGRNFNSPRGNSHNRNFDSSDSNFRNKNFNTSDGNFENRNFNSSDGKFENRNFNSPRGKFDKRKNGSEGKFQQKQEKNHSLEENVHSGADANEFDSDIKTRTTNFLSDLRKNFASNEDVEEGECEPNDMSGNLNESHSDGVHKKKKKSNTSKNKNLNNSGKKLLNKKGNKRGKFENKNDNIVNSSQLDDEDIKSQNLNYQNTTIDSIEGDFDPNLSKDSGNNFSSCKKVNKLKNKNINSSFNKSKKRKSGQRGKFQKGNKSPNTGFKNKKIQQNSQSDLSSDFQSSFNNSFGSEKFETRTHDKDVKSRNVSTVGDPSVELSQKKKKFGKFKKGKGDQQEKFVKKRKSDSEADFQNKKIKTMKEEK